MEIAMPRNTFCPICGVVLFVGDTRYGRNQQWIEDIRGILVHSSGPDVDVDVTSLTGVGVLRCNSLLSAPLDSSRSHRDKSPPECVKITLFQPVRSAWGYACHEACWSLLLIRLSLAGISDKDAIARSFARLLRATLCHDFSSFDFGHDYAGAAAFHSPFGDANSLPNTLPSIHESPLQYPSRHYIRKHIAPDPFLSYPGRRIPINRQPSPNVDGDSSGNCHVFGGLPLEMIVEVACYLPLAQVARVRLACRTLARLLRWDTLPHSFWKSRFFLGHDLDYLFPWVNARLNWPRVYFGTRAYMRDNGSKMINRKRICRLVEPIAAHVEFDIRNTKELYGASVSLSKDIFHNNSVVELPARFSSLQSLNCQTTPTEPFSYETKGDSDMLHHRLIPFPLETSTSGARIGISRVRISGDYCISGICYRDLGEPEDSKCHTVGYYTNAGEQSVEISPSERIESLEVAFCINGLVGIRLRYMADGNGGPAFASSRWLGTQCGKGVAHGILTLPRQSGKPYLAASLDTFKIITVAFAQALDLLGDTRYNTDCLSTLDPRSHLWMPQIPSHKELVISSMKPEGKRGFALYDIDFGGRDGILLGSLIRVVVHIHLGFISGLEFSYNHSEPLMFGEEGELALPFLIDGPGGERITSVKVMTDYVHSPSGIQISTTYGRINNFMLMKRICDISRYSEEPSLPGNLTITGFVACQMPKQPHFSSLGVQGQRVQPKYSVPPPNEPIGPFRGLDASQYHGYPTYASLAGVRRIQVSKGKPGKSRSPSHISGLRVDYRDSRVPVILGQWMDGSTTFNLYPGEEVDDLVVRYAKRKKPPLDQAPVLSISFKTSSNRSITFRSSRNVAYRSRVMSTKGSVNPEGKLVGMLWVTNPSYDTIRARVARGTAESLYYVDPEPVEKPFYPSLR